jgi:hypothetical protein
MTDSATFSTPEASDEDLGDLLLEVLPGDGSTIVMDTHSQGIRSVEAARGFNAQGT